MLPFLCPTGVCLNCEGNTQGSNCEECRPGFYRSLQLGLTEPCLPCPCSNATSSGTCHIGQYTSDMNCILINTVIMHTCVCVFSTIRQPIVLTISNLTVHSVTWCITFFHYMILHQLVLPLFTFDGFHFCR